MSRLPTFVRWTSKWWLSLAFVVVIGALTYFQTHSWHHVRWAVGIALALILAYAVLFRLAVILLDMISPNAVGKMDHRQHEVAIPPTQWNRLSLDMVERVMLGQWLQRDPPSAWSRYAGLIVFIMWLVLWFGLSGIFEFRGYVRYVVLFGVSVPLFVLTRRFIERLNLHRNVRALLAIGRCPVCTYDLKALVPQPDGCCVCPECGAAWRLAPHGHGAMEPQVNAHAGR